METVIDLHGEINALSIVTAQISEGINRIETVSLASLIHCVPKSNLISTWNLLTLVASRKHHTMHFLIYVEHVRRRHENKFSTS